MSLKLVNYVPASHPHHIPRVAVLADDGLIDLANACEAADVEEFHACSVLHLLACDECLQIAREVTSGLAADVPLAEARLLSPALGAPKVLCIAGNYEAHIEEGGRDPVHPCDRATPRVFMKPASNTICGPDDPIWFTRTTHFLDYEGELAVIIGRGGKYIAAADALQHVGGITCCNDVSERQFHIWDRPEMRPIDRFFDWLNGKWGDNSAPLGPCAVPLADVPDIQNLPLATRVNGQTVQDTNTSQMIFSVARLIEYISQMITLEPGDVIATGTAAGVGKARGVALQPGDVVEVEIGGVGTLRNPVVREP